MGVIRFARRGAVLEECGGGANAGLPCNGDADDPSGSCGTATRRGGVNGGNACSEDAACPGAACGPSIFELRDRYDAGVGPVVVADNGLSDRPADTRCLSRSDDDERTHPSGCGIGVELAAALAGVRGLTAVGCPRRSGRSS